nr:MAG TPA: hypothetical protein [Caudoviricetes sp.]
MLYIRYNLESENPCFLLNLFPVPNHLLQGMFR